MRVNKDQTKGDGCMASESRMDDFLQHYGVKGQKWGVRRYQDEGGSLTAEGKERYYAGSNGGKGSFKDKIKSSASKAADQVKYKVNRKIEDHKDPSSFTDAELNDRITRMRKEAEYSRLRNEISGKGNNQNNGGKGGKGKNHYLMKTALLMPVATAIAAGTRALADEKVSEFMFKHAAAKATEYNSAVYRNVGKEALAQLWFRAANAANTYNKKFAFKT